MEEAIKAANYAANQTDRWLFICALVLLGIVGFYMVRWLVQRHEVMMTEHREDHKRCESSLQSLVEKNHSTSERLAIALDRNTEALKGNTEFLEQTRNQLISKGTT